MSGPRVTRIGVDRLHNLGNFEHIKYSVSVDIPEGVDATKTLIHIETALNLLSTRPPSAPYISQATVDDVRAKEAAGLEITEHERHNVATWVEYVNRRAEWNKRQDHARAMLNDFGLSSVYKDHKEDWEQP